MRGPRAGVQRPDRHGPGAGPLTVQYKASLTISPTLAGTLTLPSLILQSNSSFDLANAALSVPPLSLATLRQYLYSYQLMSSTADYTRALAYDASRKVQLAIRGDINLNGKLNADDYALLDRSFAKSTANARWTDGDFNYDGTIDQTDYLLIDASLFLRQGGHLSPTFLAAREAQFGPEYVDSLIASVPQPSALTLAGLTAALTLPRRRRRS